MTSLQKRTNYDQVHENVVPLIIPISESKVSYKATERFVYSMNEVVYDVMLSETGSSLSVRVDSEHFLVKHIELLL